MSKLTIEQCKAIAQAEANGTEYFIHDGKAYEGELPEDTQSYHSWLDHNRGEPSPGNFTCWIDTEFVALEYDEDGRYIVLTDDEADDMAGEYIKQSLWAFNSNFLSGATGIDSEVFAAIASNNRCESNNDMLENLINKTGDMTDFINDAISADGRGHFLNTYDGEENEFNCKDYTGNNEYLFTYRMN